MANVKNQKPVLEVSNLRISFTTYNGTVKAVRGIDFSLYKGRTLAIVGESGSGKSVSSKAIMGLLAGNKIVEDGHIYFDGKDLLKLSDDEFVSIRGSRIAMIFQDPMSSLNPIMRVGKQLTEVMTLKEKTLRRLAHANMKRVSKGLRKTAKAEFGLFEAQKFLSNFKKTYTGKTTGNQTIADLGKAVVVRSYNDYYQNLVKASDYLSNLVKDHCSDVNNFDINSLAKEQTTFKRTISSIINPLETAKDTILWTAAGEYRSLIKKYLTVTKKIASDAKFKTQIKKLEEKGKKTEQSILKHQSFSSEIPLDTKLIFDAIKLFLVNLLNHVSDLVKTDTSHPEIIWESINQFFADNFQQSKSRISHGEAKERAINLLKEVGIPEPEKRYRQYPFELSGGMRQRIVIAIGLASNPEVLICDEPTTALDVTIQAQILELINSLKAKRDLSIIFITHNLGVVANMADDIAVMYAGKIVEYGDAFEVFYHPAHPYTWALLASMPDLNSKERLQSIPGTPPNMIIPPVGDAFAARNKNALEIDFEQEPPLFKVSDGHYAATWLLAKGAPKVEMPKIVSERIRINLEKNGLTSDGQKTKKGGKK